MPSKMQSCSKKIPLHQAKCVASAVVDMSRPEPGGMGISSQADYRVRAGSLDSGDPFVVSAPAATVDKPPMFG